MNQKRPILPVVAAIIAAVLVVGGRYYQARYLSQEPPRPNDPIVSHGGPAEGVIPPIDDPKFEKPLAADQYLKDTGKGIDVEVAGVRRFYPFQILVWHQIVNDRIAGIPFVIAYDPLVGVAAAYRRTITNADATFTSSGSLWNDDLLMEDRASGSLWPEGTGVATQGPLAGSELEAYPTRVMAWQDWKAAYPHGDVLSRETGAERDYTRDPYVDYYGTPAVWYPVSHVDPRLPAKTSVYGIVVGGVAKAYPEETLRVTRSVDETFGTTAVRIAFDDKSGAFTASSDGKAIPFMPAYWFFWAAAHPDTQLYEAP